MPRSGSAAKALNGSIPGSGIPRFPVSGVSVSQYTKHTRVPVKVILGKLTSAVHFSGQRTQLGSAGPDSALNLVVPFPTPSLDAHTACSRPRWRCDVQPYSWHLSSIPLATSANSNGSSPPRFNLQKENQLKENQLNQRMNVHHFHQSLPQDITDMLHTWNRCEKIKFYNLKFWGRTGNLYSLSQLC